MKNISILMGVGLFCALMLPASSQAAEGCTKASNYQEEGGLSGWPKRVKSSANKTLRDGYANGTCLWLKGQHSGGTTPSGAPDNTHVTVTAKSGGVACHVFKKSSTNTSPYFTTTCF
ncbi:hypothetical protein [Thalassospira mesophila]|uniref:Uncharacterized protein n=1 Tax=Thalassospira mesophila TaxID=1293891 RepID=A0A1Y2KZ97_9PROT|nr:hypothetical protein [Thalassospira mesophila]OSQ38052.1 hypothetical protein TMES_13965 [Thalassospira mesophila]